MFFKRMCGTLILLAVQGVFLSGCAKQTPIPTVSLYLGPKPEIKPPHNWKPAENAYNLLPTLVESICLQENTLATEKDPEQQSLESDMVAALTQEYTQTFESYNALIEEGVTKGFAVPSKLPNHAPHLAEMKDRLKVCWPNR